MTTYAITGATGFLGGHTLDRLLAAGHSVRALVRRPDGAERLRQRGVDVVIGPITDRAAAAQAFAGCDVVLHIAAALDGPYGTQHHTNVEGTRAVMHAAADAGVRRVVHVSTIAVYASPLNGTIAEDAPTVPGVYAYSVTKKLAEEVVRTVGAQRGLDWAIIRPGMIYGPGARTWTEALFRLATAPLTPFPIGGHGTAQPIFVSDVVDLMLLLGDHPEASGRAFNCTPDPAPTWRAWLTAYARLAGVEPNWVPLPRPLIHALAGTAMLLSPVGGFASELPDLAAFVIGDKTFSTARARALGWAPRFDLDAGARACADWLRQRGRLPV
jgi:nucleoside-diphosphate-sugar epimerase